MDGERQRASGYTPPPPTVAPPAGWQTPLILTPAAPRQLPQQDHAAIDQSEQSARNVTAVVGIVATAVVIVLLLVLCGRLVF
jgi:hypothetical protein